MSDVIVLVGGDRNGESIRVPCIDGIPINPVLYLTNGTRYSLHKVVVHDSVKPVDCVFALEGTSVKDIVTAAVKNASTNKGLRQIEQLKKQIETAQSERDACGDQAGS